VYQKNYEKSVDISLSFLEWCTLTNTSQMYINATLRYGETYSTL